jgi:hypothetical protein
MRVQSLVCLLVFVGCAPSVFIQRTVPPHETLPASMTAVSVERASLGDGVLDIIETFSFSNAERNLRDAAVAAVADALARDGLVRPLVGCGAPCKDTQGAVAVGVNASPGSFRREFVSLTLDVEVKSADGVVVAHGSWSGEGRPATSDEPMEVLVQRALDEAAARFVASLRPRELRLAYGLATGKDLARGNDLLTGGDPAGAVAHFRGVVGREPAMADAHYNLAVALTALGDDEGAWLAMVEAARLSPKWYEHRVAEFAARRPRAR